MNRISSKWAIWSAVLVAAFVFAYSPCVYAHGPEKHRGKPVQGVIASLTDDGFILQSQAENKRIIVNNDTQYEESGQEASREEIDFEVNKKARVFGVKLPGGNIVAREIIFERGN